MLKKQLFSPFWFVRVYFYERLIRECRKDKKGVALIILF